MTTTTAHRTHTADADLDPTQRTAVQQTLARYAFALDQHDLAALESVLTEDATWTITIAGGTDPGPLAGRVAILDFVRAAMETLNDGRKHHLTNTVVDSTGPDTAEAQAYLLLTSNATGSPTILATGSYAFTLRRVDHEWRIATLALGMDNAW
jgi:ketosteroid isomerase-like protein